MLHLSFWSSHREAGCFLLTLSSLGSSRSRWHAKSSSSLSTSKLLHGHSGAQRSSQAESPESDIRCRVTATPGCMHRRNATWASSRDCMLALVVAQALSSGGNKHTSTGCMAETGA